MTSRLDNLVKIGELKREPTDRSEFEGLVRGALARLRDAENPSLSVESRFDLAYNAAHALCLAALRWHGYRSENRYLVFQTLPDTLAIGDREVRVLDAAHRKRTDTSTKGTLWTRRRRRRWSAPRAWSQTSFKSLRRPKVDVGDLLCRASASRPRSERTHLRR